MGEFEQTEWCGLHANQRDAMEALRSERDAAVSAIREYCDFHQIETPAFNRLLGRRELPVSGAHDETPNVEVSGAAHRD